MLAVVRGPPPEGRALCCHWCPSTQGCANPRRRRLQPNWVKFELALEIKRQHKSQASFVFYKKNVANVLITFLTTLTLKSSPLRLVIPAKVPGLSSTIRFRLKSRKSKEPSFDSSTSFMDWKRNKPLNTVAWIGKKLYETDMRRKSLLFWIPETRTTYKNSMF